MGASLVAPAACPILIAQSIDSRTSIVTSRCEWAWHIAQVVPVGARRGKRISRRLHRIKNPVCFLSFFLLNPVWWRRAVKRHISRRCALGFVL